jgi:hypothetical protein
MRISWLAALALCAGDEGQACQARVMRVRVPLLKIRAERGIRLQIHSYSIVTRGRAYIHQRLITE